MRIPAFLTAIALVTVVPVTPLFAHVKLAAATPAAGASAKALKAVTLTFSDKVVAAKSSASLIMTAMPGMKDHGEMAIRNFTAAWSADGKTLTLTLKKPLPAGTYDVRWQATGADSHPVTGTLTFTVN